MEQGKDGDRFVLTDLGRTTAETFEATLPASVKERGVKALENIMLLFRRQQDYRVEITQAEDGYMLSLAIPDIGSDLLRLSIFMPTEKECETIRRRFLNDPMLVYKGIFALLTGDMKTVGDLIPSGPDLFDE